VRSQSERAALDEDDQTDADQHDRQDEVAPPGHGLGDQRSGGQEPSGDFFNEPPAGNRGAKNMGAERLVREKLEATGRGVPARLEYTAHFRDAEGNPVVEKCRITLVGEDGQVGRVPGAV
jgi:hypothetical protein